MERNINVYVYGSLRAGMGNHRLLREAEFVREHVIYGYTMISFGAFPALVPTGKSHAVVEQYRVNEEEFQRLDMLEGYPHFYDRCLLDTPDGEVAWVYFIDDQELLNRGVVEHGDWVRYKEAA